jgi:hypothetical protein
MHRRLGLAALLVASVTALVQLAQRLAAMPTSLNCYYWYAILAIIACAVIDCWGAKLAISTGALLPPGT